ncbi:MAG TPA: sporulation transcriptional regulator SpoIIID [Pseudoneobacillus sp.]|nr:sporulation transcriptional regulator SpoIIID [Pseudoneobacillus sp.]
MKSYMKERVLEAAQLIVQNNMTIREVADRINISKSTVYSDLISRLPKIDQTLAENVKAILEKNAEEKYIRGGEATKKKWTTC